MFTITLTLGRNLGKAAGDDAGKPMADNEWAAALAVAENILVGCAGTAGSWVETHIGIGVWEGVAEESAKITLGAADLAFADLVRERVARLAAGAQQDAIALAIGTSELVTPTTVSV